jgi:hypothetical protein
MKKRCLSIFFALLISSSSAFASIQLDNVEFDLSGFTWYQRMYYAGIWSTDVGYYHITKWNGNISIYGSSRTIETKDLPSFYASLQPLDKNLLPYTTPSWTAGSTYRILFEAEDAVDGLPAKKIIFELTLPSKEQETVAVYLIPKERVGLFSSSTTGYTISFSTEKAQFQQNKEEIDSIIKSVKIW